MSSHHALSCYHPVHASLIVHHQQAQHAGPARQKPFAEWAAAHTAGAYEGMFLGKTPQKVSQGTSSVAGKFFHQNTRSLGCRSTLWQPCTAADVGFGDYAVGAQQPVLIRSWDGALRLSSSCMVGFVALRAGSCGVSPAKRFAQPRTPLLAKPSGDQLCLAGLQAQAINRRPAGRHALAVYSAPHPCTRADGHA